jgi:hypothetical protein
MRDEQQINPLILNVQNQYAHAQSLGNYNEP